MGLSRGAVWQATAHETNILLHIQLPANALGQVAERPKFSDHCVGDGMEFLESCHQAGLMIMAIWEVNQQVEDLFVSAFLLLQL